MELSGGQIIVQSLKDEGVEYIFGYPGGQHAGGVLGGFLSRISHLGARQLEDKGPDLVF